MPSTLVGSHLSGMLWRKWQRWGMWEHWGSSSICNSTTFDQERQPCRLWREARRTRKHLRGWERYPSPMQMRPGKQEPMKRFGNTHPHPWKDQRSRVSGPKWGSRMISQGSGANRPEKASRPCQARLSGARARGSGSQMNRMQEEVDSGTRLDCLLNSVELSTAGWGAGSPCSWLDG